MGDHLPRRKALSWQVLRLLLGVSGQQAFLDASWVRLMLAATPSSHRKQLAIRILGLSPHYFVEQWTTAYARDAPRRDVLCSEARRLRESRRELVEQFVVPLLGQEPVVLELGCGPGFMVAELAPRVRRVVGVDVSRGALACARVLHDGPNVTYVRVAGDRIAGVSSGSVDLITSFAVIQHVDRG